MPTLNLLQSDKSLLTTNEWTLLSNLFNCYQESKQSSIAQRLINAQKVIQSSNDVIHEIVVQEWPSCGYETTGTYLRLNDDLCKLSSNDRSIMLYNAADNLSCMSCAFVMYLCGLFQFDRFHSSPENLL